MILMKPRILALATVVMLALSACGSGTPIANTPASDAASNGSSGAAGPGTTKVSVAFYPLEYAAAKVGGDKVSVTNLTLPGQEPHDLELTPQQVASLEEADLVVYLKGFQPAVDKAVEQSGAKNKLDLSQVIQLQPRTTTTMPVRPRTTTTEPRIPISGWTPLWRPRRSAPSRTNYRRSTPTTRAPTRRTRRAPPTT